MTGGTAVTELDWLLENFTQPRGQWKFDLVDTIARTPNSADTTYLEPGAESHP
jgi:hypothetical protein